MILEQKTKNESRGICQLVKVMATPKFLKPFSCAGILYLFAQLTGKNDHISNMRPRFQPFNL